MAANLDSHSVGTEWKIWDLHVHTPDSIRQEYGGNTEEVWEHFIDDLENVSPEIKVIGINDYWFLDGYKKVIEARQAGRLQNFEAIFPVVEMRINQFGGSESNLSRVNLHVIFDPELEIETIQSQFLNALQAKMKLSCEGSHWKGVITKEALREMGQEIIDSVPENIKKQYGSPLLEGFNNLTVPLEEVESALDSQYFRGRFILAMGKTEWADIKWNRQSIASKKSLISKVHLLFTAYEDVSRWEGDVESLRDESMVNHRVIDCSDAHHFSDSTQSMRIGNCLTWLKTVPTLAGLSYAIEEFDHRVYVGIEPPERERTRRNPEHFIDRIQISSESPDQDLFNYEIPLNSGFVAVVGNKGQGKSAMLDCIALAGNSSRYNEFAFLRPNRFLSPNNKTVASSYTTKIRWATGAERSVQLNAGHDPASPVSVEYLPQAFVERVCSVDPSHEDSEDFEQELRDVLFTHIPDQDRAGETSFDTLLRRKTEASNNKLSKLRGDLRQLIEEYVAISSFLSSNSQHDINTKIALKEDELKRAEDELKMADEMLASSISHEQKNEKLVSFSDELATLEQMHEDVSKKILEATQKRAEITRSLTSMDALIKQAQHLQSEAVSINQKAENFLGGDNVAIVEVIIQSSLYQTWVKQQNNLIESYASAHTNATNELADIEKRQKKVSRELAKIDSVRERLRQQVIQHRERVNALKGDENDTSSYEGLRALHSKISDASSEINGVRSKILDSAKEIHAELQSQLTEVMSMYAPASNFISSSNALESTELEFNVELRAVSSWRDIKAGLDGRRNGQFIDWFDNLWDILEDTSWTQVSSYLAEVFPRLEHEKGALDSEVRNPELALKRGVRLDDFLFFIFSLNWLDVRFGITGEKGRPLSQLSPGERGLLLALFYLVIDRRSTPLLLDQPEENLDNATIASKLVPAIHEAAGRRQTVVVTHNANLAIVGDADQVIHCQMIDSKFRVSSGSIAELDIARFALDVLEGTKPAFDNRRHKYEAFPDLK